MSTPSIKDDDIIAAVKAKIKAISPTGGNYFFAYTDVYDSYVEKMTEGINVSEGDDELVSEDTTSTFHTCEMIVYIDIIDKNSSVSDVRKMKGDILKAIGSDVTLGGKAQNVIHERTLNNPIDQLGNLICARRIVLRVTYRKNAWSA